jgi:hypothetical protein
MVADDSCSFLETVLRFFGCCVRFVLISRGRLRAFGEGLGGGYCTPPNHRDVSEANSDFGGVRGGQNAAKPKVIHKRGGASA